MSISRRLLLSAAGVAMAIGTFGHLANASAADLVVGYFPEWPMPFQFAQAGDQYQKAGLNIKWVSFDAGTAMSAAMAAV